jgi:hypothetical protein
MSQLSKGGLTVGYLALAAAAVVAHLSPTSGYELSIYTATPEAFWIAVGVALLVSIVVAYVGSGLRRGVALLLGIASVYTIGALPVVRGYFFYGTADSMTHLGWAKDILLGRLPVLELYYPGLHSVTVLTGSMTTLPMRQAMLLFTTLFIVAYFAFVFLTVRTVSSRASDAVFAVFAALLLLPVNHVHTFYPAPHPITDSVLLFPVGLYLLARYLTSPATGRQVTTFGFLLALFSTATVLYHSMQAVHLLVLLSGVAGVQLLTRLWARRGGSGIDYLDSVLAQRPVYAQAGYLGALFLVWNINHQTTRAAAGRVTQSVVQLVTGTGGGVGTYAATRVSSLSAIGVSPVEIFAKLFLPTTIFCLVAGLLMIAAATGRLRTGDPETNAYVAVLSGGLAGVIPMSLVFLAAGSGSALFFRTLAAIMAVVTILTVLAVPRLKLRSPWTFPSGLRTTVAVVAVVGLLVISIPVMYQSPYMYKVNRQVTEEQVAGHEIIFEHEMEGAEVTSLRQGPFRAYHVIYGVSTTEDRANSMQYDGGVPFDGLSSLQSVFDSDHYVSLTDSDEQREAGVFRGLRFDDAEFDSLDWQTDVHRVTSNGEFRSYLVDTGGSDQ